MARMIVVIAVFVLLTIEAPWSLGAEPMSPIGTDVAPIGPDVAPMSTGKGSPGNDDHVVGDDLC